jgi:hypothetical protein
VIGKIATMVFEHFGKTATDSEQRLTALGQVLVAKQYVTSNEWESALQEVQLGQRAGWALDPEFQAVLRELQGIVRDADLEE